MTVRVSFKSQFIVGVVVVVTSILGQSAMAGWIALDSQSAQSSRSKSKPSENENARTEQVFAGDFTVGDTILNLACEKTVDLLVMGAYVHSRRGTLTLSPVANHILRHLTMPVLMSH